MGREKGAGADGGGGVREKSGVRFQKKAEKNDREKMFQKAHSAL